MTTKSLLLIHSRDCQPMKPDLERLWMDTLERGLARHRPDALDAWKAAKRQLVYFGNILTGYYSTVIKKAYDPEVDLADRRACLEALLEHDGPSREAYEKLPRSDRFLAPLLAAVKQNPSVFAAAGQLPTTLFADLEEYLNRSSYFGTSIRAAVLRPLAKALEAGGSIAIVAHGLGAVVAYEVLWNISHHEQYRGTLDLKRVELFVALGSPLGDPAFMRRLVGADRTGRSRTPVVIQKMVAVAAADDLFAFRGDPSGWFREALDAGHLGSLEAESTWNLSVRTGVSNPHHAGGYLLDPQSIRRLADWLTA